MTLVWQGQNMLKQPGYPLGSEQDGLISVCQSTGTPKCAFSFGFSLNQARERVPCKPLTHV